MQQHTVQRGADFYITFMVLVISVLDCYLWQWPNPDFPCQFRSFLLAQPIVKKIPWSSALGLNSNINNINNALQCGKC